MHAPSTATLIVLLVIVVLLFGSGRLAQVGGELGIAIREFRKGLNGEETLTPPPLDQVPDKKELPPPPEATITDAKD